MVEPVFSLRVKQDIKPAHKKPEPERQSITHASQASIMKQRERFAINLRNAKR